MAKKIISFWQLLLSSLITLMGFSACKTAKQTQKPDDTQVIIVTPPKIKKPEDDPSRMRVLYGPPPASLRQQQSESQLTSPAR